MAERDHNPSGRRLHLPIVGVTNGPGVNQPGVRKPPWLKVRLAAGPNYTALKHLMRDADLHTVCEEAMCPNIGECWEEREATFLILGTKCTRRCGFCDVMTAKPEAVDPEEPTRIAETVARMGLRYVVLTGVARDDLPDGGASVWAEAIGACRAAVPGIDVEVLPSDFKGGERDIATVLAAEPTVFAHNLETVPRLHERIRPAFGYERSLDVLRFAKRSPRRPGDEVEPDPGDGRDRGGGHRRPWRPARRRGRHRDDGPVPAAHTAASPGAPMGAPEEFAEHAASGEAMGIPHIEAGPLVRSSYHAGKQLRRAVAAGVGA